MSKFNDVEIKGNGNIIGDNNTQNNNTTINNDNRRGSSNGRTDDGGNALGLIFGALLGLAAMVWWFFNNIDQIYYYLNIATLSSVSFAFVAFVILVFSSTIDRNDTLRFIGSIVIALALFGLSLLAREHAPIEIINLSHKVKVMDFWQGLTEHGRNLVMTNVISAFLLAVATLINYLIGFRQLSYSLANSNRTGTWYNLYQSSTFFKMRIAGLVVITISGAVFSALKGYIFQ